jgi:hypothetical protein
MTKLALAICFSFTTLVVHAAAPTSPPQAAKTQSQKTRAIATNAREMWLKALSNDMQLSADPLARAIAAHGLQLVANKRFSLTQEQELALYSPSTPVPVKILQLTLACSGFAKSNLCFDPKMADVLTLDDPKNAFILTFAESFRLGAALEGMKAQTSEVQRDENTEQYKAVHLASALRLHQALRISTHYNDYAQAFKAPILIAVKRRPPPPEVFVTLPGEITAFTSAFSSEEVAAEAFANAVLMTATNGIERAFSLCSAIWINETTSAMCRQLGLLVVANQKNSFASTEVFLASNPNHPYTKTIEAMSAFQSEKIVGSAELLGLNWLALRGVLSKAVAQGDVAAIPDALDWAERALAQLPNKNAEVKASEAKATLAEIAAASAAAEAASEAAREALNAAEAGASEGPAGDCEADSDKKIDTKVIEFKG